jgi:hypothetical protein
MRPGRCIKRAKRTARPGRSTPPEGATELELCCAPGRTRTCNLLFRRCERTVRPGLASAVRAGQVKGSSPASHHRFGLVTTGGMTSGMTSAASRCRAGPPTNSRPAEVAPKPLEWKAPIIGLRPLWELSWQTSLLRTVRHGRLGVELPARVDTNQRSQHKARARRKGEPLAGVPRLPRNRATKRHRNPR